MLWSLVSPVRGVMVAQTYFSRNTFMHLLIQSHNHTIKSEAGSQFVLLFIIWFEVLGSRKKCLLFGQFDRLGWSPTFRPVICNLFRLPYFFVIRLGCHILFVISLGCHILFVTCLGCHIFLKTSLGCHVLLTDRFPQTSLLDV